VAAARGRRGAKQTRVCSVQGGLQLAGCNVSAYFLLTGQPCCDAFSTGDPQLIQPKPTTKALNETSTTHPPNTRKGKKVVNLLGSNGTKAVAMALLGAEQAVVVDASPSNAAWGLQLAGAAGVGGRVRYVTSDVLEMSHEQEAAAGGADAVVMELGVSGLGWRGGRQGGCWGGVSLWDRGSGSSFSGQVLAAHPEALNPHPHPQPNQPPKNNPTQRPPKVLHYFLDLAPLFALTRRLLKPAARAKLILRDFHPVSTKLLTNVKPGGGSKKWKLAGSYFDAALAPSAVAYAKLVADGGAGAGGRSGGGGDDGGAVGGAGSGGKAKGAAGSGSGREGGGGGSSAAAAGAAGAAAAAAAGPPSTLLRRWTLGEVVTAAAAAGLVVERLEEEAGARAGDAGVPKLFTLVAARP